MIEDLSEWKAYLLSGGLIPEKHEELDWSGRGQHAEYEKNEESEIPIKVKDLIGHSATALVHLVKCRRTLLARKMISCNVRLRKEDAISEVEHPQKLRHSHIIRVAGTYVIGKKFAILLYPAADWNLNEFLDHKEWPTGKEILRTLACLASAVAFLHANAIKHMDIKPHNILIRQLSVPSYSPFDPSSRSYNVYLADFGIAKSYASAANAETDSLTACTRMYVAPEVVEQERRGLSADIFSLGCVFAETLSYVAGPIQTMRYTGFNVRRLSEISGFSYQANLEMVKSLFRGASFIPVFRDYHIASDEAF
ncbi:hypothetical protein SLS57_003711 [Botryosphaeria dothidea]